MIETNQVQRLYNAIVARGTRSVPTYAEVKRETRSEILDRVSFEARA